MVVVPVKKAPSVKVGCYSKEVDEGGSEVDVHDLPAH